MSNLFGGVAPLAGGFRPRALALAAVLGLMITGVAGFGTASAGHEHFLVTPGTCVEDIAGGQTSIGDASHGGYHQFHDNVHTGQPGVVGGPLNRDGVAPVIVDKVGGNADNLADCLAALGG